MPPTLEDDTALIHFRNEVKDSGVDVRRLKHVARSLLRAVGEEGSALSISLVGDNEIAVLNREHRGKDKATDVLSFPLFDPGEITVRRSTNAMQVGAPERLLGDVVISVDTAGRQAAEYNATLQNEVNRLLIHGILHVLGHDHEEPGERLLMEAEERRLAAVIGMPWPYDDHA
jgi:probable rRNA maturation factor